MRTQLPVALILASTTVACVDSASTTDAETVTSALEQENGGLDMENEAPAFDEQPLFEAAQLEADRPVLDPMEETPEVIALRDGEAARYRIAILWGQMPPDRAAPSAVNWTGGLSINRGALLVNRQIGFENETDALRPRSQRDLVQFASVTRPFVDGLVLTVIDPEPSLTTPLQLRYAQVNGTMGMEFDLGQLLAGPIVYDVGDGNSMVVTALRERAGDADPCDHGFLRGRWHALRDNVGAYRGVITNADGEVTGHIRGIWGQRRNGEPVMFGKFIAADGSFRGLVAGTYEDGSFRARWLTRAGEHGVVGGHYRAAPDADGGAFIGRWGETSCTR